MPGDEKHSLREATAEALRMAGPAVFDDANRFLSFVLDLADGDSAEMKILLAGLDDALLETFRKAIANPSSQGLVRASRRAMDHLVRDGMMQETASRIATEEVAWGIADWLGIEMPPQTPRETTQASVTGSWGTSVGSMQTGTSAGSQGTRIAGVDTSMGSSQGGVMGTAQGSQGTRLTATGTSASSWSGSSGHTSLGTTGQSAGFHTGTSQSSAWNTSQGQSLSSTGNVTQPVTTPKRHTGLWVTALVLVAVAAFLVVRMVFLSKHTITFDGAGATTGSMSSIEAKAGETIWIPTNEYRRDGYEFSGWKVGSSGDIVTNGGWVTMPWIGDVELVAQWTPRQGLANNVLVKTVLNEPDDSGDVVWILRYTNNNDCAIDLTASPEFLNTAGSVVDDNDPITHYGLGPGEYTIIAWKTSRADVVDVQSRVTVLPSDHASLASILSCTEVSRGSDGLTVRISNIGSVTAYGVGVSAFAMSGDAYCYVPASVTQNDGTVEPGQSVDLTIPVPSSWLDYGASFEYYFWGVA